MRKKVLGLLLLIFCLMSSIQIATASVIPVYVGVDYDNPSASVTVTLEAKNYSIFVHIEGSMIYTANHATFTITRNSLTYFTVTTSSSYSLINYSVNSRFMITEAGDYDFNFILDGYSGVYFNYEVLLAETEIIFQPKTSIIAEAPYGIVFIFLALIGVTIFELKRRRKK